MRGNHLPPTGLTTQAIVFYIALEKETAHASPLPDFLCLNITIAVAIPMDSATPIH